MNKIIKINGINNRIISLSINKIKQINDLNTILECKYTTVKHNLSFYQTIKSDEYLLLDELIGIIRMDDIKKILENLDKTNYYFKKVKSIYGVSKFMVINNQIINEKRMNNYSESIYKNAFKKEFKNIFSEIAYNLFGWKIGYKKYLKYTDYLFFYINDLLSEKNEYKKLYDRDELLKIINEMDKMFMIAPLSENKMVVYRGYQFNPKKQILNETFFLNNIKLGIEKRFISTSLDKNIGYDFMLMYDNKSGCCFTVFHLDDGIPFINCSKMSYYEKEYEILLPRDLELKYLGYEENFVINSEISVTAYHIQVSLTRVLKKKYKKSEKCVKYNIYELKEMD
uniref:ADP ribosyltransferase domain-containing protein n=1 Tax=viral metagenome TaxID=1070528 RepID=A0A6C0H6M3_9ZZZZ